MEIGSHDPLRDAARSGELPDGWIIRPDGARVPAQRDRDTGWGDDRDMINVAKIDMARARVARAVKAYEDARDVLMSGEPIDMAMQAAVVIAGANAVTAAWHEFAEMTGENR